MLRCLSWRRAYELRRASTRSGQKYNFASYGIVNSGSWFVLSFKILAHSINESLFAADIKSIDFKGLE